eukprot:1180051-Prorocentrum_minimum.AAC.2
MKIYDARKRGDTRNGVSLRDAAGEARPSRGWNVDLSGGSPPLRPLNAVLWWGSWWEFLNTDSLSPCGKNWKPVLAGPSSRTLDLGQQRDEAAPDGETG